MKLEQQVVSLELAKRLKELGVKQESYAYWWPVPKMDGVAVVPDGYDLTPGNHGRFYGNERIISAFTVAELGEMLPQAIRVLGKEYLRHIGTSLDDQWFVVYVKENDHNNNAPLKIMMCHKESDARAKMLIHLIEKGIVKP